MELEDRKLENGIRLVHLRGRLDMKSTLLIDAPLAALTTSEDRVLIDLSGVDFIASIGIRLLITNAKAMAARGARLVLCNAQPLVGKTLETVGIQHLIPLLESQEKGEATLLQS